MRILTLLCTLLVGVASAKPLHSDAKTIRAKTRVVVSGTLQSAKAGGAFRVQAVHWDPDGHMKAGGVVIPGPNDGFDVRAGESAVLLLDAQRIPIFAAQPRVPVPAAELGGHPLWLRGFYAFNAHLATPAVTTLAGLVRGMETGRFEERVRLDVTFGGTAAAFDLEGRLIDGALASIRAEHAISEARVSPWDHQVRAVLAGKTPMTLVGTFEALDGGVLYGRLVPDTPFVPDEAALATWLETGAAQVPLTVQLGEREAVLMLTGHTRGALGPGLGVEGQLAGFLRQTKSGYRSQSGRLARGKAPGRGWHIEIRTPRGPLWITLPVEAVDAGPRAPLRGVVHPQTHIVLAARRGPLQARFSGVLQGEGRVSMR